MEQCTHVREDGRRCGATFGLQGGLCWHHDPARASAADAARAKGGRVKAAMGRKGLTTRTVDASETPGGPPETAEDARRWTSWAIWAVAVGKIDARTAKEIGYVARAFLAALDVAELQRRIKELQSQSVALKGNR